MAIDFEMTYPCYAPYISVGVPDLVTAMQDGVRITAVILFTDQYLLQDFIKAIGRRGPHITQRLDNADAIAQFLTLFQGYDDLPDWPPVTHVAIDPSDPAKLARIHSIPDMLEHLRT